MSDGIICQGEVDIEDRYGENFLEKRRDVV